jgi:4-amino-4-deoxy-L-arabinose transferase-like glycosyltransferase
MVEMTERASRRDLLLVALLGLVLFLPGLGLRDLWNPDEARYAEVAREMRLSGEYVLPHLNGQIYTQKPPLLFWSILGASALTGGLDETAARLPSALAGVGALVLVFLFGQRLFGRRPAWLAAVVYGTCFKTFWQARFGQIDMLLGFLVALALWLWLRGYTERRPGFYLGFYAVAGLGTLAKGPVGLLPPLLAILAFLFWNRERDEIRRLHLGGGLLLWAGVVLAWLVPAALAGGAEGGSYLREIVFKQNVTRYADPWHHFQPPWYFLKILPADFFPWSLLLPSALVLGWRRFRGELRKGYLFALCWFAATVLFFSISPAKRSIYIFQMYPAMALLVGAVLDRLALEWPQNRRWLTWPFGLLAGFLALGVVALPIAGHGRQDLGALGGDRLLYLVSAVFVPLLVAALAAFWSARSGRAAAAGFRLAAGFGVTGLLAVFLVLPRFDIVKSARPLSRILLSRIGPGEPYGIHPRLDSAFLFYTGKLAETFDTEAELRAFAARPGKVWLLIEQDDLEILDPPLPLVEVARDADVKEGYVLLTRP